MKLPGEEMAVLAMRLHVSDTIGPVKTQKEMSQLSHTTFTFLHAFTDGLALVSAVLFVVTLTPPYPIPYQLYRVR